MRSNYALRQLPVLQTSLPRGSASVLRQPWGKGRRSSSSRGRQVARTRVCQGREKQESEREGTRSSGPRTLGGHSVRLVLPALGRRLAPHAAQCSKRTADLQKNGSRLWPNVASTPKIPNGVHSATVFSPPLTAWVRGVRFATKCLHSYPPGIFRHCESGVILRSRAAPSRSFIFCSCVNELRRAHLVARRRRKKFGIQTLDIRFFCLILRFFPAV